MQTKITYIYGLSDGSNIKYVGKADNPHKRKMEHVYEAQRSNKTEKDKWINESLQNGKVTLEILEVVPLDKWVEREKFWVKHYGFENLTNRTKGGKGKNAYDENMKRSKSYRKDLIQQCISYALIIRPNPL